MNIAPGDKIGPYEVLAQIGAGGMGEVWKARDTRLNRIVAIKTSKVKFDERFDREARAIAQLNHPHICQIYDVGPDYLVMEYVDGAPLKGPLTQGKALEYAGQILAALDHAHRRKIIHRDLKPSNILVTTQGVKLLDFGLARMEGAPDATLTQEGAVMGTPAYMAPEQWAGKPADARSDIYAFGFVLYELLTGKRAAADRAVVEPPGLESVLNHCTAQDPEERWQSAKDLRQTLVLVGQSVHSSDGVPPASKSRYLPWAVAALSALVAAVGLWAPWHRIAPTTAQTGIQLDLNLGAAVAPTNIGPDAILSPDGSRVVFVAEGSKGKSRLMTRRVDESQPEELRGSEGAYAPFFAPDGKWVAFFSGGKLKKTRVDGGEPMILCEAAAGRGGSWSENDTIVAALDSLAGLSLIPAAGGQVVPLTELAPGENSHRWPQVLPGGKTVVFSVNTTFANFEESNIGTLSLADRKWRIVLERAGIYPRYVPSGHLIYVSKGNLFAAVFDLNNSEIRGRPVALLEEVSNDTTYGFSRLDFSATGMLLYRRGRTEGLRTIRWLDGGGNMETLEAEPAAYQFPRFSPDGNKLIWIVNQGPNADLWIYDWQRGSKTRLTDGKSTNAYPVWSPDGRHVVFSSPGGMFWTRADGAGKPQPLTSSKALQFPRSFTPDGTRLVFSEMMPAGAQIQTVRLDGGFEQLRAGNPEPFLRTRSSAPFPALSPDGRWLAYADAESGSYEVYVRAFPDSGKKWLISNSGGTMPVWSRNQRELFYRTEDGHIMVATYSARADVFVADKPRVWSHKRLANTGLTPNFDITPDGKRFAVLMAPEAADPPEVHGHVMLLTNFFDEIRRLVPNTRKGN